MKRAIDFGSVALGGNTAKTNHDQEHTGISGPEGHGLEPKFGINSGDFRS